MATAPCKDRSLAQLAPLIRLREQELRRAVPHAAELLAAELRSQYKSGLAGILLYGSCLRSGTDESCLLDLLLLVDDYRSVYGSRRLALLNAALPPNVFYKETRDGERTLRAKYAVVSTDQFARYTSSRAFQSYFWARFAQPCALVWARDKRVVRETAQALAVAVTTLLRRTVPLMPPTFDAGELWVRGLKETYGTELRPESSDTAARLVQHAPERYDTITEIALPALPVLKAGRAPRDATKLSANIAPSARRRSRLAWRLRRLQGKLLNLARLGKAAFTFHGGVDYLVWKVERHSGVRFEPTPRLRRHPLLFGWWVAWRLYRRGGFH
jgi:hypothetical protein